jgi:hypothetical protein
MGSRLRHLRLWREDGVQTFADFGIENLIELDPAWLKPWQLE